MIQSLQVDRAEYDYLKHLADTLGRLEKCLHNTDNASEILKETFRTACEFYGADWAGFLEVDPESNVWWPFDWLSIKSNDMTKNYLDEFEPLSIVPRWVAAMELNQAIALRDREEIKDDYPEEYALYERVKLYSVLAVPVKPRPCGFLAVRNPTKYVDAAFADVLQLLAFVALVNINDIMQKRMRNLIRSPKDIKSANEAINNIIRHYRSRFLEVVEKMIHILYESKQYNDIRQAAEKGLTIEPCNPVMYFWLIVCSHETAMLTTERDYIEEARKHLVEEEYAEMLEKLAEFGVKI